MKDYPTNGVLKLIIFNPRFGVIIEPIRKDYPTNGVLKQPDKTGCPSPKNLNQGGLPDYWGIETESFLFHSLRRSASSGYPITGVLKLVDFIKPVVLRIHQSGRTTRLLGY